MHQFFVPDGQIGEARITILGEDVSHIGSVLRMRPGERVRISGASGQAFFCRIEEIGRERVVAAIEERDEEGTEFAHRVCLFQGLPKNDKMEWIVQKSVELGVCEVIPVAMKRCVVKLDERKAGAKQMRWQAIAESAAKQSKRTVIPTVQTPVSWEGALAAADGLDAVLVPYENERGLAATRERIRSIREGGSIGLLIGPEGGFAPEELTDIDARGFSRISLGRRILRTETAALAALAMLIYELDV